MTLLGLLSGLFILVALFAFLAAIRVGQAATPAVLPTRRNPGIMLLVVIATGLVLMGTLTLLQGWARVMQEWWPLLQLSVAAGLLADLPWRASERLEAGAGGHLLGTSALAMAIVTHAVSGSWPQSSFALLGLSILSSIGFMLETRALRRQSARRE